MNSWKFQWKFPFSPIRRDRSLGHNGKEWVHVFINVSWSINVLIHWKYSFRECIKRDPSGLILGKRRKDIDSDCISPLTVCISGCKLDPHIKISAGDLLCQTTLIRKYLYLCTLDISREILWRLWEILVYIDLLIQIFINDNKYLLPHRDLLCQTLLICKYKHSFFHIR